MYNDIWDITKVIELTGYSRALIAKYCREGVIKAEQKGNIWLIPKEEIIRFLEDRKKENLSEVKKLNHLLEEIKNT